MGLKRLTPPQPVSPSIRFKTGITPEVKARNKTGNTVDPVKSRSKPTRTGKVKEPRLPNEEIKPTTPPASFESTGSSVGIAKIRVKTPDKEKPDRKTARGKKPLGDSWRSTSEKNPDNPKPHIKGFLKPTKSDR